MLSRLLNWLLPGTGWRRRTALPEPAVGTHSATRTRSGRKLHRRVRQPPHSRRAQRRPADPSRWEAPLVADGQPLVRPYLLAHEAVVQRGTDQALQRQLARDGGEMGRFGARRGTRTEGAEA